MRRDATLGKNSLCFELKKVLYEQISKTLLFWVQELLYYFASNFSSGLNREGSFLPFMHELVGR